jgi:hypothetical protein
VLQGSSWYRDHWLIDDVGINERQPLPNLGFPFEDNLEAGGANWLPDGQWTMVAGAMVSGGATTVMEVSDFIKKAKIIHNETGFTTCTVARLMLDVFAAISGGFIFRKGVIQFKETGKWFRWSTDQNQPKAVFPVSTRENANGIRLTQDTITNQGDGYTVEGNIQWLKEHPGQDLPVEPI